MSASDHFAAYARFGWKENKIFPYDPWVRGVLEKGFGLVVTWVPPADAVLITLVLDTPPDTFIRSLKVAGDEELVDPKQGIPAEYFRPMVAKPPEFGLTVPFGRTVELFLERPE